MTWQGGKKGREIGPSVPFARLKPFASTQDDPAKALEKLAQTLSAYRTPVRLHIRLVTGNEEDAVEHWEVQAGSRKYQARQKEPKTADVIVIMRRETWTQIARGDLAPYEALYAGKLRVGGDFELAKAITKFLSDPATPYVAPC